MVYDDLERLRKLLQHAYDDEPQAYNPLKKVLDLFTQKLVSPPKSATQPSDEKKAA